MVSYPCKTREMNRAMEQGVRTVRYDPDLGLEAYHFSGVIQIFPGHFHEYYTLGFLERGLQHTICRGIDCLSEAGDRSLRAAPSFWPTASAGGNWRCPGRSAWAAGV